jgi:hypothetical protein
MWTDIVLGILGMALYVGPFAALPFILRRQPAARRVAILALLVAPLIGALMTPLMFHLREKYGQVTLLARQGYQEL